MTPTRILMAACEEDVEMGRGHRDRQHLYETPTLAYKWGQRGVVSGSGLPVRGSRCRSQRSAPGSPCGRPRVLPEQENIKTYQSRSEQERGIIGPVSLLHSCHWVLFLPSSPWWTSSRWARRCHTRPPPPVERPKIWI